MANGVQDITSLMITPIQRLPRYVLLLKELRKRTPDDHPDAQLLESALADVQVVADHVNERLRSHEDNARILEVQSSLWASNLNGVPNLLEPGRRLVREGTLTKVRSNGLLREVKVFLFSDIFLYASCWVMYLGRMHYHNHITFYGAGILKPGDNHFSNLAFKITSADLIRVFICRSLTERDEWISAINHEATGKRDLDSRRNSARSQPINNEISEPKNSLEHLRNTL